VLTAGNGVKCWGKNSSGQLGDGTTTYRYTPVDVIGLSSGVAKLTLGWSHTCAVTVSGGAKCWGWNIYGQLGDGTTTNRNTPIDVSGLSSGVAALAGGQWHTCAVTAGGGVKCWGYNSRGQLGDGTTTKRSTPVDVTGLGSGVTALAAGGQHTCALTTNGGVKCWGANRYGQLGDGTNAGHYTPVAVSGLGSGVTALAAGEDYTCALTVSGGVKCWGANYAGELGDGTATDRNRPVTVSGLDSGATNLTAGREHACALVAGRTVCWGQDGSGQLGIGTILQRLTPVAVTNSAARVSLNYSSGKPGSYFSVTGENFPVSSTLTVTVNSAVLTTALRVNETGSFIFFLNTGGADAGAYTLMVDASLSSHSPLAADSTASAVFMLIPAAPLRVQEGGGATVSIPAGIARPLTYLYLPLIMR
jgi:alpha-tubulin suppressor-like RCC1 family protein